jgi:glycosyltransferase involved in cell wall biosynthesis
MHPLQNKREFEWECGQDSKKSRPVQNLRQLQRILVPESRLLRLCFCISHYHPIASGAERQAHRQARELVRRGHHVRVLTRHVPGHATTESLDGVVIERRIRPVSLGPLFGAMFLWTARRALSQLRAHYDIIHCHQALWEAAAAGSIAPQLGKRTVVQPAASGAYGEVRLLEKTRGRHWLRRWILRNDRFVAISAEIAAELHGLGVPAQSIVTLSSGVDTDEFSPGPSAVETTLPSRPRVLFLGRLHPQKNLGLLLAAWPAVRTRTGAHLILAGVGPDAAHLREQAARIGCHDSVHFLGPVANPSDYLRAVDLFVLPSLAEGMSNSLLEAMACGVTPVVSSIGGNIDLVASGHNGVCVGSADPADWSEQIARLILDTGLRARLGAAARQDVLARYSMVHVVDRYEALYRELLGTAHELSPDGGD